MQRILIFRRARRAILAAWLLGTPLARAESGTRPPEVVDEPVAEWPAGHALPSDLVVPVTLMVDASGAVQDVALEASIGEPFDAAAIEAARRFRFAPARDERGPRRAKVRAIVRFKGVPAAGASRHEKYAPDPVGAGGPPGEPSAPRLAASFERAKQASEAVARTTITVVGAAPPRSASEAVVEKAVLSAAPHRNASELLLTVPGVFVSQHSGEGKAHQIFFRGFDAVHGQDVELWAGGAPVNDVSNIHGQGYADLHFLIPEVVKEIRSSPGNYDPEQGDFAVAGTMRFELGYDEPGISAKAALGSFGSRRYFMAYHPKQSSDATFGAFELASTDGFGPSRAARHASAIGQTAYDFGGGIAGRVMASTYAGRFDSAGVVRLDDVESGRIDRFATYDPKQGGYSSRTQLVLELGNRDETAEGKRTTWALSPFVVLRSLKLRSDFTGTLTSSEGDSIQQRNDATTLGATASYRRELRILSERDSLEAGLFLRSDSIRQSQHRLSLRNDRVTDDALSPGVQAEVRASDAAGYIDASVHPVRRVTFRAGLRADALSYMTEDTGGASAGQTRSALGGQLSKRATLDVNALTGVNAIASYGEGFRSPQARSLGEGETTPFTRVTSYEAGLRFHEESRYRASLAAFHTTLSDDLVFDQAAARNELVPGTSRTGVAASLVAEPRRWFVSSTSFTYVRAVFSRAGGPYRSGDLLPYVPQLVVRSDLAVTPTLGRVFGQELRSHFGCAFTYLGRRPLPYAELGHDAFLTDISASIRLGPLETGLEIFNLFDADWYDGEFVYASQFGGAPSLVPVRHVSVGPPRSLFWSLSLHV
jgi:TonB family protein